MANFIDLKIDHATSIRLVSSLDIIDNGEIGYFKVQGPTNRHEPPHGPLDCSELLLLAKSLGFPVAFATQAAPQMSSS